MILGTRKIRSAGRSSGSIEVTLPAQLQDLEGVECRLVVRDGPKPEIVLQPDLSAAQGLFRELWHKLRLGLGEVEEIGDFAPSDFTLTLFPSAHWHERPPLACADALLVLRQRHDSQARAPEALARLVAFMAVAAGQRLGLQGALALAFGDSVAYLIAGAAVGMGNDFERGMAHQLFWETGPQRAAQGSALEAQVWQQARSGLRRIYEQFYHWQEHPDTYSAARTRWHRALTLEQTGGGHHKAASIRQTADERQNI